MYPNELLWPSKRALSIGGAKAHEGLVREVLHTECNQYSDEQIRVLIANARSDVALNSGLLYASHQQMVKISRGVWLIAFLLLLVLFR
jgi:hypothetical protein